MFTRSLINRSIDTGLLVADHFGFCLPPFAEFTPRQWEEAGPEYDPARHCMLGWDVTDFGSGDFERTGRVLFTLRNGRPNDGRYPKPYAEKLLIDPELQRAPAHFHRTKREDIICRAGGNLLVRLHQADSEGRPSDRPVTALLDGCFRTLGAGETVRLRPGMSITIAPGTIHQFWGEEGTGAVFDGVGYTLSSEISSVCDDWNDNVFLAPGAARFPRIEEDEPRRYYLCHEYPSPL